MINIRFKPENNAQLNAQKEILSEIFPESNPSEALRVLEAFGATYFIAREYFAYYYVMGTQSVIDYVNFKKIGYIWELLKNAMFDSGINVLYGFYSKNKKSKHERILLQCEEVLKEEISPSSNQISIIKELMKHRNNNTAHRGNAFHSRESSIMCDTPLLILEQLRVDRLNFKEGAIQSTIILTPLADYFCEKIGDVIDLMGEDSISVKQVRYELKQYVDSVLSDTTTIN